MNEKIIEKKEQKKSNITDKLKNFHQRWNIDLADEERWNDFKNRLLNSLILNFEFVFYHDYKYEEEFCRILGVHEYTSSHEKSARSIMGREIKNDLIYKYFKQESDIKKILLGIEVISWMETIDSKNKVNFINEIYDIVNYSSIPVELKLINGEIIFYSAGAKLLDESLINDNLDWLSEYPLIYEIFKKGLSNIGVKGEERHVIDNLRLAFELLLKNKLNNTKSIENQKEELGKYLKSKGISSEISNLFWIITDYYSKYQNNKIKHSNNANPNEVEFILYLTGTLMRLILTV